MNDTQERSLSRHTRLYRMLLLAYPRAFRQVYGADMAQVFGDRLRAERARRGRRANLRVWLHTLLDLFKTAPLQRMEKKMTREAAFAILFALVLAAGAASLAMGGPGVPVIGAGVVVLAAAAFGISGALRRDRTAATRGAGKLRARDWWVVVAALAGLLQLGAVVGQLIQAPSGGTLVAFGLVSVFALLLIGGAWYRSRSRSVGDWMIVVGVLPFFGLWWMIWPTVIGLAIIVMALIDSARTDRGSSPEAIDAATPAT